MTEGPITMTLTEGANLEDAVKTLSKIFYTPAEEFAIDNGEIIMPSSALRNYINETAKGDMIKEAEDVEAK